MVLGFFWDDCILAYSWTKGRLPTEITAEMSNNFSALLLYVLRKDFFFCVSKEEEEKIYIIASYSFCLHQQRERERERGWEYTRTRITVSIILFNDCVFSFHLNAIPRSLQSFKLEKAKASERERETVHCSSFASCERQLDWKQTDRMRTRACKVFASIYMCTELKEWHEKVRSKSLAEKNEDKRWAHKWWSVCVCVCFFVPLHSLSLYLSHFCFPLEKK